MGGFSLREKCGKESTSVPFFAHLAKLNFPFDRRCDALPFPSERWESMLVFARFYSAAGGRESFLVSPRFRIRPQATTTCIQMYSTKSLNQRLDSCELSSLPLRPHTHMVPFSESPIKRKYYGISSSYTAPSYIRYESESAVEIHGRCLH